MTSYVYNLRELHRSMVAVAGGKGASLGELFRVDGVRVPEGFCISAEAYREVIERDAVIQRLIGELQDGPGMMERRRGVVSRRRDRLTEGKNILAPGKSIAAVCGEIRQRIEGIEMPAGLVEHIGASVVQDRGYAVRSSATVEDLPTASAAGQQDSYLNVIGVTEILRHVRRCWASLFTDRAVMYRAQNGIDHRKVFIGVVVQEMVLPRASGVMFTADPVRGSRNVVSIDAVPGLGDVLVSGLVNAEGYTLRGRSAMEATAVGFAMENRGQGGVMESREKGGGMESREQAAMVDGKGDRVVQRSGREGILTDMEVKELARVGRRIEAHFGSPHDIEWCLAEDGLYIVQSRPITTLFPVPDAGDEGPHVFVSVGHQQMMTDALKPLGLSIQQMAASRPFYNAGGRLFVDIMPQLMSPAARKGMLEMMGQHDPLMKGALISLIERGDLVPASFGEHGDEAGAKGGSTEGAVWDRQAVKHDPALAAALIKEGEEGIAALRREISSMSGMALFDFIPENIRQMKQSLFDKRTMGLIMAGLHAHTWINSKMEEWLGEKGASDALSQSVDNNITSEMGLALMDLADVIRPYLAVIHYLEQVREGDLIDGLAGLPGGEEAARAIDTFLDKYGMRCVGEIDITRERWSERPSILAPIILGNIRNFEPGASRRMFEKGRALAAAKEKELLARLRELPDGAAKAAETEEKIRILQNVIGYREYPKYVIVSRYAIYKQALLKEAERLVQAGVIREKEDIYYLRFEELREVVRTGIPDPGLVDARAQIDVRTMADVRAIPDVRTLVDARRAEFRAFEKLTPPRVMTSEGEIITGAYNRTHMPANALAGLAVSAGVVEGRARVLSRIEDAQLEAGDILVTSFTDPSWTPVFVSIRGLVTEVGGLMTHGAVIAREYGLPAVIGVENATQLIKDGDRVRVNGTEGYVEVL